MSFPALAGCIEDPTEGDADAATLLVQGPVFKDGTPAPVQDVLSDCQEAVGSFPVPASEYWDFVPTGFRVAPYTALGTARSFSMPSPDGSTTDAPLGSTPPDPTAFTGEVVAVASACQDDSSTVVNRLILVLMVEPPAELVNDAATFGHLLLFAYFTDSQAHADVLDAWGFGSVVHVVSLETQATDAIPSPTSQTAASANATTARLETRVAGAPTAMEGSAARFFAMDHSGKLSAIADASFGAFDAMVGHASLSGSAEAGIWQTDTGLSGPGLHVNGHTNTWTHVALDEAGAEQQDNATAPT